MVHDDPRVPQLSSIRLTKRSETPAAPMIKIYPDSLQEVKTAWLGTGNSVGFEIFELVDPKFESPAAFNYNHGGFFHIAITAPDPEAMIRKVVAAGGKQIGNTIQLCGHDTALYLQDPWGNVVEVMSCSFEHLIANR